MCNNYSNSGRTSEKRGREKGGEKGGEGGREEERGRQGGEREGRGHKYLPKLSSSTCETTDLPREMRYFCREPYREPTRIRN